MADAKLKDLEERKLRLEERKRLVLKSREIEDEDVYTEEMHAIQARRKQIESRKRDLEDRKRALADLRKEEDEDLRKEEESILNIKKQELAQKKQMLESRKKELEDAREVEAMEQRKREIEEKRVKLSARKSEVEEKRRAEDQRMKEIELEEERKMESKKKEFEAKRAQLEKRKQDLQQKRQEEDRVLQRSPSVSEEPVFSDLDTKRKEIEEKRRLLEEKKQQLAAIKASEEEQEAKALEDRRQEIAERRRVLMEKKSSLLAERTQEDTSALDAKKREIEEKKRAIAEKRAQLEALKAKEEADTQRLVEDKRLEIEDKRRALEEKRKQLQAIKEKEEEESAQRYFEEQQKTLEERRKAIEQRRRALDTVRERESADDEAAIEAKKAEIEAKKKLLLEKRQKLSALKQKEETEDPTERHRVAERKRLVEETYSKANAEIAAESTLEAKRLELEEKKKAIEERRRALEHQREREIADVERDVKGGQLEIEEKAKFLEQRKEQAESAKSQEEALEEERALEARRRDITEKKKLLEEKRRQMEIAKQKELEDENRQLEAKRNEIAEKKRALAERRRELEIAKANEEAADVALAERRRTLDRKKKELQQRRSVLAEQRRTYDTDTLMSDEPPPPPAAEVNDDLASIAMRKMELEQKKRMLEEKKKALSEMKSKDLASEDVAQKRIDLEERKRRLEEKRKQIEEAKALDDDTLTKRKEDLAEKKRLLEERRKALRESKSLDEASQNAALAEQEEINRKKAELEERRRNIQTRKRMLEDFKQKEEQAAEAAKQDDEELQKRKQDLETRRKLLEERRKALEVAKAMETKDSEETQQSEQDLVALEQKRKELEDRRRELEVRKMSLRAAKEAQYDEKAQKVNQEEAQQVAMDAEIDAKRKEIEERRRVLEERRKLLEEAKLKEEQERAQQEELQRKRQELEERRKAIEDRKQALAQLREKEEREMLVIEDEQMELTDREEVSDIKFKQMQLDDRKRKLQERKEHLEKKRQEDEQEAARAQQEEQRLTQQKLELEEKRKAILEKMQQVDNVGMEEGEATGVDAEAAAEIERRKAEIEAKRREIEAKRKQIELERAAEEAEEIKRLEATQRDIANRQQEYNTRLKYLEDKLAVPVSDRAGPILANLSEKEQQYLNALGPEVRRALENAKPIQITKSAEEKAAEKSVFSFGKKKEKKHKPIPFNANTPAPFAALPALTLEAAEKDWREAVSADGRKYYWNPTTQQTTWQRPKSMMPDLSDKERELFDMLSPTEKEELLKSPDYEPVLTKAQKAAMKEKKKVIDKMRKDEEKRQLREEELRKKQAKEDMKKKVVRTSSKEEIPLSKIKQITPVYKGPQSGLSPKELLYLQGLSLEQREQLEPQIEKLVGPKDGPQAPSTPPSTRSRGATMTRTASQSDLDDLKSSTRGRAASKWNASESSSFSPVMRRASEISLPLHEAAKKSNKDAIVSLINEGTSINLADPDGITVMHIASLLGDLDLVKFILGGLPGVPANLNLQDKNGWTPLHTAAFQFSSKTGKIQHLRICEFLLKQPEVNPTLLSKDNSSVLHFYVRAACPSNPEERAVFTDTLRSMIRKGVDPNSQNAKGETCLHQAALRGSLETVDLLLNLREKDIDAASKKFFTTPLENDPEGLILRLNLKDKAGETPLHFAAKSGNIGVVNALIGRMADLSVVSEQGTPKEVAANYNQLEIARLLGNTVAAETQRKMPSSLWSAICQYLPAKTLISFSQACKQFRRISDSDDLWRRKCLDSHITRKKLKHSWKQVWKQDFVRVKRFVREKLGALSAKQIRGVIRLQACARSWNARREKEKRKRMNNMRDGKIRELVDTEKTYLEGLKMIVKLFLQSLTKVVMQGDTSFITMPKIKAMFSNIEVISDLNTLLYENLKDRRERWSNSQKIGDIFLSMAEQFRPPYTQYINNFNISLSTYEECKKNPLFEDWIKGREKVRKLNALLILPIQRIPRYLLLLKEIIQSTWKDHIDYQDLCKALEKMETLARVINESKGLADEKGKILEIDQSVEPSPRLLRVPSRKYLREGEFIEVMSNKQRIPLYLFLFNDILLFCRPQKKKTDPPKYKYGKVEKLWRMSIRDVDDVTLEITTTTLVHTVVMDTAEKRASWSAEITAAITKAQKLREGGAEKEQIHDILQEVEDSIGMPSDTRVKIMENAIRVMKQNLADDERTKEQAQLSKQNLEMQVKQATNLLNSETKARQKFEAEVAGLKEQIRTMPRGETQIIERSSEIDGLDRLALDGLSAIEKQWLGSLTAREKQSHIEFLRQIADPNLTDKEKKKIEKKSIAEIRSTMRKNEGTLRKSDKEGRKSSKAPGRFASFRIGDKSKPMESTKQRPTGETSAIIDAAQIGNKELVRNLVESGASINTQNVIGQTCLHIAAFAGNYDLAYYLIINGGKLESEKKVDINVQDDNGWTPLHTATYQLSSKTGKLEHLKICELLLQSNAIDVSIVTKDLNTPLHHMARVNCGLKGEDFKLVFPEVLRHLMEKGVDPNAQNIKGETCLHQAALEGSSDAIIALLQSKRMKAHSLSRASSARTLSMKFNPNQIVTSKSLNASLNASLNNSNEESVPSQAPIPIVDINLQADNGETALHSAVRANSVEVVTTLLLHWIDFSIRGDSGTAEELAISMKYDKVAQVLFNTRKKETTPLPIAVLVKIFHRVEPVTGLQPIPLVSKAFRRASGKVKTDRAAAGRRRTREMSRRRDSIIKRFDEIKATEEADLKLIKISKDQLESQLKRAASLLAEETSKRALAERKLKDIEMELLSSKDPERVSKLEETVKKQRLANDSLQQQFLMQMDRISTLEKQLKQYQAEKLEYETKYEERVFFMEQKFKEKRDGIRKQFMDEIRELKMSRSKLEEINRKLKDQLKEMSVEGPAKSTGPAIPKRPSDAPDTREKETPKETKQASAPPQSPRQPPARPPPTALSTSQSFTSVAPLQNSVALQDKRSQEENYANLALPTLPSTLAAPPSPPPPQQISYKLKWDLWENNSKLVLAVDIPGTELDLVDISIARYAITITRKVAMFEEKHLTAKYKALQVNRHDRAKFGQSVKEMISLPCAVLPNKKQAFHHHGTIFLTVEKLPEPTTNQISKSDFHSNPNIF
eukprot:TRINITY_DN988_c0_g1_i3.p1 TRINITY_DN988_c0_g1~~TRINITY_DN988_c0_g1_i3.p1  ORF type:complete len:3117 (+),score=1304.77 TRINITY_DN988_c0_g1_i3:73-9423(+)